jgi:hypothetical protein
MPDRHDDSIMSLAELSRTVRRHDQDMYFGNGKPGITTRLNDLENYRTRTEADLYESEKAIIPNLTSYFAVIAEREKHSSSSLNRAVVVIGGLAVASPILWDVLKHSFGWMK